MDFILPRMVEDRVTIDGDHPSTWSDLDPSPVFHCSSSSVVNDQVDVTVAVISNPDVV